MERGAKLYEGKSKALFETAQPDVLLQVFKDDATAFNGAKKGTIVGKGAFNCGISTRLFRLVEQRGVPTHLVDQVGDREQLVRRVRIVPLEFVVRNVAAGSLSKRYGMPEGAALAAPMVELFVKDDALGDPLIGVDAAVVLGFATEAVIAACTAMSRTVNDVLSSFFAAQGVRLIDFKLEFGFDGDRLVLADEITPDGCRLWDAATGERLDKDRFRRDLGQVEESYARLAQLVADGARKEAP